MFRFDQDPDALDTIANIGDEGGYFASSTDWFHGLSEHPIISDRSWAV
jgi:hypothetical protein